MKSVPGYHIALGGNLSSCLSQHFFALMIKVSSIGDFFLSHCFCQTKCATLTDVQTKCVTLFPTFRLDGATLLSASLMSVFPSPSLALDECSAAADESVGARQP